MEKHKLTTTKRTITGRKVKTIRKQGLLPGNVYGKGISSQAIQLPVKGFSSVYAKAGETGLIELTVDGKTLPVLIQNVQHDPVTHTVLHADFFNVNLKEKITADIPLVQTGESTAVKDKTGVLLTMLTEVTVEALPTDLPDHIEVDVSTLSQIDQTIKVKDLKPPARVAVVTDEAQDIVKVAPLVSKEAEQLQKEQAETQAAQAAPAGTASTEEKAPPAAETAATETPKKE